MDIYESIDILPLQLFILPILADVVGPVYIILEQMYVKLLSLVILTQKVQTNTNSVLFLNVLGELNRSKKVISSPLRQ